MDIPAVFSTSSSAGQGISPTDGDNVTLKPSNDGTADFGLDPLAGFGLGTQPDDAEAKHEELVTNDTIRTSDRSKVGNFNVIEPEPEPEPVAAPVQVAKSVVKDLASDGVAKEDDAYNISDPVKLDFIKTYTSEYDATVARALTAVQAVLKAIDETVKNHNDDIAIPESANEFIDQAPAGGRVPKFDDAQSIVRSIMDHANTAKSQSEEAAREAAKIYDDIQRFKKNTEQEVIAIKSRDEFGRTAKGLVQ